MNAFSSLKRILGNFLCKIFPPRGTYYINGSDTLPSPLSREEEARILSDFPLDEERKKILIGHNLRLVVYIAKRFENTGIGIEDLISIGTMGLVKAIGTFQPDKNIKLATYASRCIENEILMYIRKIANQRGEVSIDEPLNVDWDGNELLLSDILSNEDDNIVYEIEQREEKNAVRKAVLSLPPREKEIIEYRYGLFGRKELTQKEVADSLGISQSYISRLEKKILDHLREKILSGR